MFVCLFFFSGHIQLSSNESDDDSLTNPDRKHSLTC